MIYHFPDLDTLRLAITSGVVPPEISMAPATALEFVEGHVWLEPSVPLPRKVQTGLRKIGAEPVKDESAFAGERLFNWPQALPLEREAEPPVPSPTTPVLFELPDADLLPDLVTEMLRLGNDRQGFRFLKDPSGSRVLLRVVGPPYYSLLRALERADEKGPVAYLERVPRVWVELGYTHPLVQHFKEGPNQLLLMRPRRDWTFLEDAPFQDIYEILDFTLPAAAVSWKEARARQRLKVSLRLRPSSSTERPDLWVLREQAVERLDTLVRESDEEKLVHHLAFAVFQDGDRPVVVLRVRPSKQAPPVVVLEGAVGFRPFAKLPNLFLPCGRELRPALRRDMVRQLLAPDPDQVTWLWPHDDGTFTPERVPDAAFRPLADWVDYVLDRDHQALQTWIQAATFDFQGYVCGEDERPPAAKPPPRERKGGPRGAKDDLPPPEAEEKAPSPAPKKGRRKEADDFAVLPQQKPGEMQLRLRALENQFLDHDGPLDAEERLALWPEMATLHTALGHGPDAAVCWLNALWEAEAPPREWAALWLRAEQLTPADVTGATLDRLLAKDDPPSPDVRALAACVVAATAFGTAAEVLGPRLPRLRQYLERYESRIGVRAVWLAWVNLVRLSAGDVLGLARTRDRLLERLLTRGLELEQDLPSFLRCAGQRSSERFQAVRDRLHELHRQAIGWIDRAYDNDPSPWRSDAGREPTKAYTDLSFAFGFARLGEAEAARRLQDRAREVLHNRDAVHSFFLAAYTHRIRQALEQNAHGGPLPPDLLQELAGLASKNANGKDGANFLIYKINRLRSESRILEPQEQDDPYRHMWLGELNKALFELSTLHDRQDIARRYSELLAATKQPDEQLSVLRVGLELAPRVSEPFALEVLDRFGRLWETLPPLDASAQLQARALPLQRALFLAAHFDRAELVQLQIDRFLHLVESLRGEGTAEVLAAFVNHSFRGLRKLGLRDETDRLLQRIADLVFQGRSLSALRIESREKWRPALGALLQIAAGWLYFGRNDLAMPILAAAHEELYAENLTAVEGAKLAGSYAHALGQAPVDLALHKLGELFQHFGCLPDPFQTNTHYSWPRLRVVESVVLAVVSDDFALSQGARRWLDEDEYLVRRRVHRDLRALMAQSGL